MVNLCGVMSTSPECFHWSQTISGVTDKSKVVSMELKTTTQRNTVKKSRPAREIF